MEIRDTPTAARAVVPMPVALAIRDLAARFGVHNVRVFGSVARGESRADSDLDLLVTMEAGRSLLDLVAFGQEVEQAVGGRVDVVSEGGLSPHLRDRILREAIPI